MGIYPFVLAGGLVALGSCAQRELASHYHTRGYLQQLIRFVFTETIHEFQAFALRSQIGTPAKRSHDERGHSDGVVQIAFAGQVCVDGALVRFGDICHILTGGHEQGSQTVRRVRRIVGCTCQ